MSIDFEQEKREELDGVNDAKKLSDQVVKLQELEEILLVLDVPKITRHSNMLSLRKVKGTNLSRN
jgi:hypothetical protein